MADHDGKKDFFVSYNKNDREWAEWIAWPRSVRCQVGYTAAIMRQLPTALTLTAILALGLVGCGGSTTPGEGEATIAPPTPTSALVAFPYTWVEEDVEIAVIEVIDAGLETDALGGEHRIVEVPIVFRNLAHERRTAYGVVGPLLAIKTDRGNIYKGGFTLFHLSYFGPEEVKETNDYFQIRPDEVPVELWMYEPVSPGAPVSQQQITHIWHLE